MRRVNVPIKEDDLALFKSIAQGNEISELVFKDEYGSDVCITLMSKDRFDQGKK